MSALTAWVGVGELVSQDTAIDACEADSDAGVKNNHAYESVLAGFALTSHPSKRSP